jgi:hypothetical protein
MLVDPPSFAEVYAAFDRGDRTMAKQLLIAMVRSPGGGGNGQAWWLLAQALDDPEQQTDCRRRAEAAGYVPPGPPSDSAPPVSVPPAPPPAGAVQAAATAPPLHLDPDFAAATDFVIDKLSENMDRYELIKAVMVRQGWPYEKAQRCVDSIAVNQPQSVLTLSLVLTIFSLMIAVLFIGSAIENIVDRAAGINMFSLLGRLLIGLLILIRALRSLADSGIFRR